MNKFSVFFFLLAAFLQWQCTSVQAPSTDLDRVAVSWQLVSNQVADSPRYRASFTLTNRGDKPLSGENWSLFFSQTPRDIFPGSIDGPGDIKRVNGDLYQLKPSNNFTLPPGDSLTITYEGEAWLIKDTDAPLGLFFVKKNQEGEEETVRVNRYTVWPFERPEQYSRHMNDKTAFPDPASVYEQNAATRLLAPEEVVPVIPQPKTFQRGSGTFTLDAGTVIHYGDGLQGEAGQLQDALNNFLPNSPEMAQGLPDSPGSVISLKLDRGISANSPEAYQLNISDDGIEISGKEPAGVFYGIQSLLAIIPTIYWGKKSEVLELPHLEIQDSPLFNYRGIHLDIARNFNDLKAIRKLIDGMAFYKLNKLHLHLTDDEGWRLEIPGLPELTQVGAQRGYTYDERDQLQPAYGSGDGNGASHGSGYLSRSDFIELLQYATQRHIEVIPELNVPGHARAAIKAMEARYHRLSVDNDLAAAEAYRLADPEDRSEYRSVQYYPDNVICVCCESTYRFYEKVVDEVKAMFTEAGAPLTTIHTGGDEVPGGVWTASPACESLIAQEETVNSVADLPTYFFNRIYQIISERNLKAAGWEEVAMKKTAEGWIPHPDFKGGNVIPYVWENLWGKQDLGYRLANAGYPVVLCNVTNLYFDLAYNKDPREPGFYWGGFVDTRKVFDFQPYDIFASTTEDPLGNRFDPAVDYQNMERLQPSARQNILGIQGQLWSETIKGPDMLEYYYFPKMLGLSERAWGETLPPGAETWEKFANTVGQHALVHLDYLSGGYNYRIPTPGAKVAEGKAMANVAFPGLEIRYTTDGSNPQTTSTLYTEPVAVDSLICFKAFDQRGRSSRMVCVNTGSPQ